MRHKINRKITRRVCKPLQTRRVIVVGFQGDGMVKQMYNLISFAFEGVDGTGFQMNGNASVENVVGGTSYKTTIDHIETYEAAEEKYTSFFYRTSTSKWVNKSLKNFETVYEDGLPAGTAIWYFSVGDEVPKFTQSGAVLGTDDASVELVCGMYSLLANPYPTAWTLNGTNVHYPDNIVGGSSYKSSIDRIETYDAAEEKYTSYFYRTSTSKWSNKSLKAFEDVADPVASGIGVWYFSVATDGEHTDPDSGVALMDVTFDSPIVK